MMQNNISQCPKHNEIPFSYFCVDASCQDTRIYCDQCRKENRHYGNPQKHRKIDSLPNFLQEQLYYYENLLNYIEDNFRTIIEFKEHLIQSIRRKYHISLDQFNIMEIKQKCQALNSLIHTKQTLQTIKSIMNHPFEIFLQKIKSSIKELHLEKVQYPEQISQQQAQNFQAYFNQSQLLSRNGNNVEALEKIDNALAVDAGSVQALNLKGNILLNSNQLTEAFEIFTTVLQIDSRNVQALLGQGQYYLRTGDETKALDLFFRVTDIDQNNQEAQQYINIMA